MAFCRSSLLILSGLAVGGVLFLAHRVSQETGKGFTDSLAEVPAEARELFSDLRGKTEEAIRRGREAYQQKQAEIDDRLEEIA